MLYVFALNEPVETRLTDLTRARGEVAELPPLAAWLGVEALDTERVELFPVADLGDMGLSQYLSTAYVVEPAAMAAVSARLDALEGPVLIVQGAAITGVPQPGPQATEIAQLTMVQADHNARLDPAVIPPISQEVPAGKTAPVRARPWAVGIGLALAALLLWWLT